jgi:hypothetical protein
MRAFAGRTYFDESDSRGLCNYKEDRTMRRAKMLRVVLLALVIGSLSASLVYAEKPPLNSDPPVVDGLLDARYDWAQYFPRTGTGDATLAPGNLWTYTGDDYYYWAFVVDRAYNDNVFCDTGSPPTGYTTCSEYLALDGWKANPGHDFQDLEKSDYAEFDVTCDGGVSFTALTLNYLNAQSGSYESGQIDDSWNSGLESPINEAATSLHWNMENADGWYGTPWTTETHSPPYNFNDTSGQYWEWQMIYEFRIPRSVGTNCVASRGGSHNSPYKELDDPTLGSLGDYVWFDEPNEDGVQNDIYGGVANVTVHLYDGSKNLLRTTQTAPSGYYIFNNLPAGNYYIQFDPNSPPPGFDFTTRGPTGSSDPSDSDPDPNPIVGGSLNPDWGWTELITLDAGENDMTWDAGIVTGGGTAVTLSSFAAGTGMPVLTLISVSVGMMLVTGGLLWARRRTS